LLEALRGYEVVSLLSISETEGVAE